MLKVKAEEHTAKPLDRVTVEGTAGGVVSVRDAMGREYVRAPGASEVRFRVSGALGHHLVFLEDDAGKIRETTSFRVDCRTEIEDEGGRFHDLLDMLYYTMTSRGGSGGIVKLEGKFYKFFVRWLRDHVHTLKGMKYFAGDIKTGIELYADHQQDNGMIWDLTTPATKETTWRDHTFSYGGFIAPAQDGKIRFERIPVENDVEYLFLEGLYYTWKATGDDAWMAGLLDNAIRAVEYSTTDPYRWSEKYGLLKRGFTIDTWDFQSAEDAAITGHAMVIDKDKTRFGVMHGDNTGFVAGLRYLAEMLTVAGRAGEAGRYGKLADEMKQRLDKIAWNGKFYTHHVPEDPSVERDLGVDLGSQVSLSNAYDLNRGLTHEQCVAIIKTYQRIREDMPATSPGEFYQIYPPFERGFGGHNSKWHYRNAGVTTIVAGELAHGAFEHGFEEYGADILDRVRGWGEKHEGFLHCTLRGAMREKPERSFGALDISAQANVDFFGEGADGVTGWTGEGPKNDLRRMSTGKQSYHDIPFDVIDPAANGRRACLGISSLEDYSPEISVPVGRKAASLYFLHALAGNDLVGWITLRYADGETCVRYIHSGREIAPWYMPRDPGVGRSGDPVCKVAWRGGNGTFANVGCYVFGMDNPHPERDVAEVVFTAAETGCKWFVLGVTACDAPVYFPPSDLSFGIPHNWGAAAVVYALIEGLAGVKDTGRAFDRALLAPRWPAAGVRSASATVKYEASGGYVRYRYALDEAAGKMSLEAASSADSVKLEILLPEGKEPKGVTLDGKKTEFETKTVESSRYVCLDLEGIGVHEIEVALG